MTKRAIITVSAASFVLASILSPASARSGSGSSGGQHHDITVTKSTDKSSSKMMMQGTSNGNTARPPKVGTKKTGAADVMKNIGDVKGESTRKDHEKETGLTK